LNKDEYDQLTEHQKELEELRQIESRYRSLKHHVDEQEKQRESIKALHEQTMLQMKEKEKTAQNQLDKTIQKLDTNFKKEKKRLECDHESIKQKVHTLTTQLEEEKKQLERKQEELKQQQQDAQDQYQKWMSTLHIPKGFTALDDEGMEETLTFELFDGTRQVPLSVLTSVPHTFFTALVHMKSQEKDEQRSPVVMLDRDPVCFDQAIRFLQSVHKNQIFHISGPDPVLACDFEYYLLREAYMEKCERDCRPQTDLTLLSIQDTKKIIHTMGTEVERIHTHVHDIHENLTAMTRGFGDLHMSHTPLPCSNKKLDKMEKNLTRYRRENNVSENNKWTIMSGGRKPYN